jgi:hypothetical protein
MRKLSSFLLPVAAVGALVASSLAVAGPAAAWDYSHGRYERHAHFDRHHGFDRGRHEGWSRHDGAHRYGGHRWR